MTDIEIPIGKRTKKYRFFEMLPAFISYSLLLIPIVLSLINPFWAAVFIIVYVISWFVKAIGMASRTIQGYNTLQKAQSVDWGKRLADLEDPEAALQKDHKGWRASIHVRNLKRIVKNPGDFPKPSQIFNAIIIPTHNEGRAVLEPTIQYILDNDFDPKKVILIIGYEERGGPEIEKTAKALVKEYGNRFYHADAIKHPDGLPNEVRGKGGNITWAGRELNKWLVQKKINPEDIMVTTLDADNRPHHSYLSYIVYEYIINPERRYLAFQPVVLFLNNIWDVPAPMRVIATGNSFWTMINSLRPHMLRNFSSHSQGMKSLIDTDFWSVRTIVEDGHHFWRTYFRYDGRYDVVPIYVPIYQDAVLAETYRKTLKAQFGQLRRWAYGASDVAYVAEKGFGKNRTVPLGNVIGKFIRLLDGHVSWASASIIIAFGAWAPLLINPEANRSIVAHQLPTMASQMMQLSMIGLFFTIFLSMKLLPPRPERYKRRRTLFMVLQWVIMPVTSIIYGSAAALNAQTRLLTGNYLETFDATKKAVVTKDKEIKL